jgi:hypothetical protein
MVSPSKHISALCFVHMHEQPQQTFVRISEVGHFVPHSKLLIHCIPYDLPQNNIVLIAYLKGRYLELSLGKIQ